MRKRVSTRRRIELDAKTRARAFRQLCKDHGLPEPVQEHRFWPGRRFAFDWAFPDQRIAVETEGGIWTRGRHVSGAGYKRDMLKYSEAAVRGWIVIRCEPKELVSPQVLDWICRAFSQRRAA